MSQPFVRPAHTWGGGAANESIVIHSIQFNSCSIWFSRLVVNLLFPFLSILTPLHTRISNHVPRLVIHVAHDALPLLSHESRHPRHAEVSEPFQAVRVGSHLMVLLPLGLLPRPCRGVNRQVEAAGPTGGQLLVELVRVYGGGRGGAGGRGRLAPLPLLGAPGGGRGGDSLPLLAAVARLLGGLLTDFPGRLADLPCGRAHLVLGRVDEIPRRVSVRLGAGEPGNATGVYPERRRCRHCRVPNLIGTSYRHSVTCVVPLGPLGPSDIVILPILHPHYAEVGEGIDKVTEIESAYLGTSESDARDRDGGTEGGETDGSEEGKGCPEGVASVHDVTEGVGGVEAIEEAEDL
mmetsp:Transcript_57490/g.171514  ORF Transcript_57490/g.171514 Transcript_57490/m.171514 type:complete len:349 (+) Transcript_57490:285-1331(+)